MESKINGLQAERINKVTSGSPFLVKEGDEVQVSIPYTIERPVELIKSNGKGKKRKEVRGGLNSASTAMRISTILHEEAVFGSLSDPTED